MYDNGTKNITVIGNDDYVFAQQLLNYPVVLSHYWKSASVTIDAENQNKVITIPANNYPILVKDILVVAYCQLGAWEISPATPRDRVTVSIKSGRTDEYFMDEAIDIIALSPNIDRKITPFIIREDSNWKVEFQHRRAVANFATSFPAQGTIIPNNSKYDGLLAANSPAPNPFPIQCNIIIVGSKIFPKK